MNFAGFIKFPKDIGIIITKVVTHLPDSLTAIDFHTDSKGCAKKGSV